MNNFISGLILLVCFLVIANAYIPYLSPIRFRNIVIFGDSTSDTGNVFALTDKTYPIPPYYWKGRFCNGPNWVDQLEVLGISNYAYGSATTDNNLVTGYTKGNTIPVPGMLQQIETYLSRNPVKWIDFSRTLYVIYGGPNDFIYNNTLPPNVIIASLLKGVELLLSVGAKNIIIFNIPPVQYYPFTRPFNNPLLFTELGTYANLALTGSLGPI
jgi:phospholipase/lecithinase/hemolysin